MIYLNSILFFVCSTIAYTLHKKGLNEFVVAFNALAAVVNLIAVVLAIVVTYYR